MAEKPSFIASPAARIDCDDARSDVKPGQTDVDTPYDGKDKNCGDVDYDDDGDIINFAAINDFDQDGDGWLPFEVWDSFVRYARYYEYGDCSGTECGDNCRGEDANNNGTPDECDSSNGDVDGNNMMNNNITFINLL